ncbi:MAG: glycosyltransferase, partial [Deltaproteobacteria bacterium]|nr:glycosyltransferase [Deltaproteobacteria bacterium]
MDVIVPTKNCASDLEECLKSLRSQLDPVRVIVVDAHSTDGTREVAEKYGAILVDEPPSDVKGSRRAVACNEGLRHSTSRYVAFLDADVVVPPTWSRDMVRWFERRPYSKVAAVTSGCVPNTRPGLGKEIARIIKIGSTHAHQFDQTTLVESVPGYNSVYLREALDEVGGFNEQLGGAEDWELNRR